MAEITRASSALPHPRVAIAVEAMATRFELLIWDEAEPARLRAAGEEALAEIVRAEERLSFFRRTSEVAWINAKAGGDAVRASPAVFDIVARSAEIARLTDGAFDPTVGPLLRAWGFRGGEAAADLQAVHRARRLVGMQHVELHSGVRSVRLPRPGMELDLGGIGKGAAVDEAIARLEESGVHTALLHGGTSSVHTIGESPGGGHWRVGWQVPAEDRPRVLELGPDRPALAVSASHGRTAGEGEDARGHVIDPRSGEPARASRTGLVSGPSSTLCDALSTALLVLGVEGPPLLARHYPAYRAETA